MEELVRAREESFEIDGTTVGIRFASAEDTLLYKLVWYRLGGEHSAAMGRRARHRHGPGRAARPGALAPLGEYLRVTDLLERALPPGESTP